MQAAWEELFPFADQRALEQAGELGLPTDPQSLAGIVGGQGFPGLVAALVRVGLVGDQDRIRENARSFD